MEIKINNKQQKLSLSLSGTSPPPRLLSLSSRRLRDLEITSRAFPLSLAVRPRGAANTKGGTPFLSRNSHPHGSSQPPILASRHASLRMLKAHAVNDALHVFLLVQCHNLIVAFILTILFLFFLLLLRESSIFFHCA